MRVGNVAYANWCMSCSAETTHQEDIIARKIVIESGSTTTVERKAKTSKLQETLFALRFPLFPLQNTFTEVMMHCIQLFSIVSFWDRISYLCRDSSVGRALDWRSKGPRFDPGSRQLFYFILDTQEWKCFSDVRPRFNTLIRILRFKTL